MDISNLTIETKNLRLESISLDFKDDIFKEFTPEITTYMYPKPAEKIEETIEHIESSIKENKVGSDLNVVVLNKKTNEFLGRAGVHHIDTKTPELGIWIKKSEHSHGYGKEAIVALKEWADNNIDYEYLLYPVAIGNKASRNIPEFLGGKVEREYDEVCLTGRKNHFLEYRIYPSKY